MGAELMKKLSESCKKLNRNHRILVCAAFAATRPSGFPAASSTYHLRSTSPAFGIVVAIVNSSIETSIKNNLDPAKKQDQAEGSWVRLHCRHCARLQPVSLTVQELLYHKSAFGVKQKSSVFFRFSEENLCGFCACCHFAESQIVGRYFLECGIAGGGNGCIA